MMRRIGALLILVAGCRFTGPGGGEVDPDAKPSGGSDGDVPAQCTQWTTRANHITKATTCNPMPSGAWTVSEDTVFDTTNGTYTTGTGPMGTIVPQVGGGSVRLISVESFTIASGKVLRVIGAQPLLVLSSSTIQIAGIIDVSSTRNGATVTPGAGANRQGCTTAGNGMGAATGGGGGGGGYSDAGGRGGKGDNGSTAGGTAGGSISQPTTVAGGCPGGKGGTSTEAGVGGAGGGAIQLTAKTMITLLDTAEINAGGMGGQGAQGNAGGGGGGSGGFIGLDAPTVMAISGALIASNGGGGGTGCDGNNGPHGANGSVGTARAPGGPAATCTSPVAGGGGGSLGQNQVADRTGENGSDSQMNNTSGGGGGGGVGYILVWANSLSFQGIASPDYVRVP